MYFAPKFSYGKITKYASAIFLVSLTLVFGVKMATSEQPEVKKLFQRTGQPLTVFAMNPPDEFTQKLNTLNQEFNVLRPQSVGDEPVSADVWIFFVESINDVASLPGAAKQVFGSMTNPSETDALRYTEFTIADGSTKAAVLLISGNYRDKFKSGASCIMAVDAFNAIYQGFSIDEFKRRRNECNQVS